MTPFDIARALEAEANDFVYDEEDADQAMWEYGFVSALWHSAQVIREQASVGMCPGGDENHWTDKIDSLCSDCEIYWDTMREDFWADQMLAFPLWVQGLALPPDNPE